MQTTTNLQLSIYESNDVTSYLEVDNSNMRKIDAGVGAVQTAVTANTQSIGALQEDVSEITPTVADANTKANAGLSNTASVYDATQTYAIGDYTLYNNNLYRCDVPIPQAESFDGTKWTRVKTTDEIKACKENITQINANLSDILPSSGNMVTRVVFGTNSANNVYASSDIPFLNANSKNITLTSVIVVGENTERVSRCSVDEKTPYSFNIIFSDTTNAVAGKVVNVWFSYS